MTKIKLFCTDFVSLIFVGPRPYENILTTNIFRNTVPVGTHIHAQEALPIGDTCRYTVIQVYIHTFHANRNILIMSSYAHFAMPTSRQAMIQMYGIDA